MIHKQRLLLLGSVLSTVLCVMYSVWKPVQFTAFSGSSSITRECDTELEFLRLQLQSRLSPSSRSVHSDTHVNVNGNQNVNAVEPAAPWSLPGAEAQTEAQTEAHRSDASHAHWPPDPHTADLAPDPVAVPCPEHDPTTCDELDLRHVLVMMITGGRTRARARLAQETWLTHIPAGNLVVVTDEDEAHPEFKAARAVVVVPEAAGTKMRAQRKWIPGLARVWAEQTRQRQLPAPQWQWLLVVDDDTYVVVRHLAKFLATKDARVPRVYGQRCGPAFFCGGAGWVMSAALMESVLPRIGECETFHGTSDEKLSRCLQTFGLWDNVFVNSREFSSGEPFHYLFTPEFRKPGDELGLAVTFHYIREDSMRTLWAVDAFLLHHYRRQACLSNGINPQLQLRRAAGPVRPVTLDAIQERRLMERMFDAAAEADGSDEAG